MSFAAFLLGCLLGSMLAGLTIVCALLVIMATGSLWLAGVIYFVALTGYALIVWALYLRVSAELERIDA